MNVLTPVRHWAEVDRAVFVDLVRIYVGIGLFVKGVFFMMNREYLVQLWEGAGSLWFAPAMVAHYVIPAHLLGGFLIAIGLLTRVAAIAQIPILVAATFYVYLPRAMSLEPRQHLEFSALVLFICLLLAVFGAGRWSVDNYLAGRRGDSVVG